MCDLSHFGELYWMKVIWRFTSVMHKAQFISVPVLSTKWIGIPVHSLVPRLLSRFLTIFWLKDVLMVISTIKTQTPGISILLQSFIICPSIKSVKIQFWSKREGTRVGWEEFFLAHFGCNTDSSIWVIQNFLLLPLRDRKLSDLSQTHTIRVALPHWRSATLISYTRGIILLLKAFRLDLTWLSRMNFKEWPLLSLGVVIYLVCM